MRLTLQTDYALRMLTHLAARDGALVTIAEVADRFGASKNHMMKVAHELGRAGFIETVRGRAGGLRLVRHPRSVTIGAVVRAMEADFALVECFPGRDGECAIESACRLKHMLDDAVAAFMAVLDVRTLEDLTRRNPSLRALFEDFDA